jgi:DNA-binding NtrC family response regulator
MNLEMQAKLLTLLDNRRVRRIGGVKPIEVDIRFVATTNTILLSEVTKGKFREDLYYRLQVVALNVPPLRERGEDVLVLTDHFLDELNERFAPYGRRVTGLDREARAVFLAYRWPGNVRELQNLLERIFILESDSRIGLQHLPPRILRGLDVGRHVRPRHPWATAVVCDVEPAPDEVPNHFHAATDAFQRQLITQALARAGGRLGQAAASLGLSRHALRHYVAKLHVR